MRFPDDFMFRLTAKEKQEVVTNCDHLRRLRFSPTLPLAFSEHGALMLVSVLKSPTAVESSIQIVRTYIRMREALMSHAELGRKLQSLERRYDTQFKVVFDAIRRLMEPPRPPRRPVGFKTTLREGVSRRRYRVV